MSDDLDLVEDEAESTLALDEEEELEDGEDSDDDGEEEEAAPLRPPQYKVSSNLYTILLILAFLAYTAALVVTIREMEPYCSKDGFMWGMFK